jgi:Zn-dependent metalloprotease
MRNNRLLATLLAVAAVAAPCSAAAAPPERAEAVRSLTAAAVGPVTLDRVAGTVRHAGFAPGAVATDGATPTEKAELFLLRHGASLGIDAPALELVEREERRDGLGRTRLVFDQVHRGVPVFGGRLSLHFNDGGELIAVAAGIVPDVAVDEVSPRLSAESAGRLGRAMVGKRHGLDPNALAVGATELVIFNDGVIWGRPGLAHLCWRLEVGDGATVAEHLFIDAATGALRNRIDAIEPIQRYIYEFNGSNLVWQEGDPLPYTGSGGLRDDEINNLIEVAAQTYDTFSNLSGGAFLSWTGDDGSMRSYYDREGMDCPNAYFDGSSTSFCVGTATDDVTAHEWTHGYTRSTHGLIYQWQSGALNEAYSDIFGETVDLLYDSGSDDPSGVREPETCSAATTLEAPELVVEAPAAIAGPMDVRTAEFNPAPPWSVTGTLELADDGVGNTNDGCEPLVGFTPGRIALLTMGGCSERFLTAASHAQDAGAIAAIIVNPVNDNLTTMGGPGRLDIPAVFLGKSNGQILRDAVTEGVVVRMTAGGSGSLRWLVAEDSSAFGGAIRDMWRPECLGDPGRVSSSSYYCSDGDNGGVHANSGVPNHAFALLVDGGVSNGVEVPAIGLNRAASLYWRAMMVYQVPLSDLRDHADSLVRSCQDLIGAALPDVLTGAVAREVVSAADCAAVEAAMAATEMRDWPVQCGFATILEPDPPVQPGSLEVFAATFDTAPAGWTLSNEGVYAEYEPRDWVWTTAAPDGADGGVFYAIDSPHIGDCRPGSDDQSGVMYLDSPPIALPRAARPVVRFDHYVATEERLDGGNLRVSVDGGPFELVPTEAFLFNPYNDVLRLPEWNDNPLAGEPAFVGTDATTYRGSWGQSQVDLGGLVEGGQTIVLRFAFGVDGCNGQDGWYVDNVVLTMQPPHRGGGGRVAP